MGKKANRMVEEAVLTYKVRYVDRFNWDDSFDLTATVHKEEAQAAFDKATDGGTKECDSINGLAFFEIVAIRSPSGIGLPNGKLPLRQQSTRRKR
jgi:hypothetical protein